MAITTGALVLGGIMAGSQLAGAKMQSSAAKNAAKTQAASADKAIDLQRQMYEQQRADQMPWLNEGRGAVSTLGRLMGVDSNPAAETPMTSGQATPNTSPVVRGMATGRTAVPRGSLASLAGGGGPTGGGGTSSFVQMKAPDGTVGSVPADQVQHFLSKGAVQV